MCPPGCGELDKNASRIVEYRSGILVQTTGDLEDDFDYESMLEAGDLQQKLFSDFRDELKIEYPNLLALGNGTCKICETCAYPDSPCRNPDRAISSMEAFGLIVNDVCTQNDLGYYYGPQTITYTGCFLLR
jgi:predicted metal-binding protein